MFHELAPPSSMEGRWSHQRDDIGLDVTDFSFWLEADAVFLLERRDNG